MKKDDKREVTDLSPAGARDYAARIQAAKSEKVPVGGVEMPKMPRFDQPPPGAPGDRHLGVQQAAAQQRMTQAMSPDQYAQAVEEGRVVPGVGGAYTANQPRGTEIPQAAPPTPNMERTSETGPVNPPNPSGGLSGETIEGLKAIGEANKDVKSDDPLDEVEDDEEYFDELGSQTKNILVNKKRRKVIEAKITGELSFEDLVLQQELRQEVPIRRGFRPTYRTPTAEEDLFIKRLISKESAGGDQYIMDKFTIMNMTLGLFAINGNPLPDHTKEGKPDIDLFKAKLDVVLKYPIVIVADLSANFMWFQNRVQGLLSLDKVKDF